MAVEDWWAGVAWKGNPFLGADSRWGYLSHSESIRVLSYLSELEVNRHMSLFHAFYDGDFFMPPIIESPSSPALDQLCLQLAEASRSLDAADGWPAEQLQWCADAGVFRWFHPLEHGGFGWSDADIYRGYLRLSAACLTTTFVLTQRVGACRRLATGQVATGQADAARVWLPELLNGSKFATVGISHLTTSRQHVAPVLTAECADGGFVLDGYCPWVTGGRSADFLVIGATLEDGREILAAVDAQQPGVQASPHAQLIGLTASQTGRVDFERVWVPTEHILAGPIEKVMKQGVGGQAGGLQTSVLAAGLASQAVRYLEDESKKRAAFVAVAAEFRVQVDALCGDLLTTAEGQSQCTNEGLRTRANSLVLRATQAAMTAAKGAGYTAGHPVGRWCREAMFFLVWSCPEPVLQANMCELAGIA
jgi:alkylation response protein AidB-like acyl-CoA dehydrogenase